MSKINELFRNDLHVVNFGIESFYQDLKKQGKNAVHVNWKPIAGGDREVATYLRLLKNPELQDRIQKANQEALGRILAAQPTLIGLGIAGEVIPGMTKDTILHAGLFPASSSPSRHERTITCTVAYPSKQAEEQYRLRTRNSS